MEHQLNVSHLKANTFLLIAQQLYFVISVFDFFLNSLTKQLNETFNVAGNGYLNSTVTKIS